MILLLLVSGFLGGVANSMAGGASLFTFPALLVAGLSPIVANASNALQAFDALDGIEWTPQAGIEGGGHARWHPMYKKIVDAGKCVQAIGVSPDEVQPLLNACGSDGVFIMSWVDREEEARRLVDMADKYR